MNYDQLQKIHLKTSPRDWILKTFLPTAPWPPDTSPPQRAIYKPDLEISLRWFLLEGGETYQEKWQEIFDDTDVPPVYIHTLYNGVPVDEHKGIRIDNRRCIFPYPQLVDTGKYVISRDEEEFFRLLNGIEGEASLLSFERCLEQARHSDYFSKD